MAAWSQAPMNCASPTCLAPAKLEDRESPIRPLHRQPRWYANSHTQCPNQGSILRKAGRLAEALTLYREAEAVYRGAAKWLNLKIALRNQAAILGEQGQREAAIPVWNEICDLSRRFADRGTLLPMLSGQAMNYYRLERFQDAQHALGERAAVLREPGDLSGLAHTLVNQAAALAMVDDPRLEEVQAEAPQIFREHPLEDLDPGVRQRLTDWAVQASANAGCAGSEAAPLA
jgi:tetratricopeptide (TPR) repeat protein